jgi:hypothetical protein
MKSLRITSLAFLLVAATGFTHAADSTKDSAKADKKSAAKADDSGLPDPVAVVEGVKIKRAELEKEFTGALASAGKSATDLTKEQKQQGYRAILQDIIIDRLLRKRSADLKVNEEEVNKNIEQLKAQFPSEDKLNEELKKSGQTLDGVKENIRTSMRQQQWIEARIAGQTDVSDADVKAFYDQHPESFKQPEMVRAGGRRGKEKAHRRRRRARREGRGFQQGRLRSFRGSEREAEWRRPQFLRQGADGARVFRRRVQARKGQGQRPGEDAVRIPHHQGHRQKRR